MYLHPQRIFTKVFEVIISVKMAAEQTVSGHERGEYQYMPVNMKSEQGFIRFV